MTLTLHLPPELEQRLTQEAKRHGLTLQWAQIQLIERLTRLEQQTGALLNRNTRAGDADAQTLQLEAEALALVLEAVHRAYPAGADIEVEKGRSHDYLATRRRRYAQF